MTNNRKQKATFFYENDNIFIAERCNICDTAFIGKRWKSNLNRHMRETHSTQFTCGIDGCQVSFSRKGRRDDHRRTHLDIVRYPVLLSISYRNFIYTRVIMAVLMSLIFLC